MKKETNHRLLHEVNPPLLTVTADEVKEEAVKEYGRRNVEKMMSMGLTFKDEHLRRKLVFYEIGDNLVLLDVECFTEDTKDFGKTLPQFEETISDLETKIFKEIAPSVLNSKTKKILYVHRNYDETVNKGLIEDEECYDDFRKNCKKNDDTDISYKFIRLIVNSRLNSL